MLGHLHPRDAPLLERTGSFGDTPATLTSRPGMLIARFQPFSAVIGDSCALLMDSDRASSKVRFGCPPEIPAFPHPGRRDLTPAPPVTPPFPGRRRRHRGRDEQQKRGRRGHALTDAVAASSEGIDPIVHARIATSSVEHKTSASSSSADIPVDDFPLRALECVLDEATGYYHQKMRRLKLLTDYCLETITDELKTTRSGVAGEAGFQRLLPLRRAMTELENDIREAHHAISDAMRSDERVDGLLPRCSRVAYAGDGRNSLNANLNANLNAYEGASDAATANDGKRTENASEGELSEAEVVARRKATVRLLQTHLWRIRAAGGQLEEMSRQVEDTRQVWELFLDGVRNRTVRLNLQATIATLALTVTAVPASLAGMNIPSGLEHAHPFVFWGITAGLAAASAATWGRFMGIYRGGTGLSSARAADLRALRFVLQRMDELDDAMRVRGEGGKGAVKTRDDLAGVVREAGLHSGLDGVNVAALDPAALELLFKVFDRDGDGRINPSEEWVIRPWPLRDENRRGDDVMGT